MKKPDENRFKLGQVVVDRQVHRPMVYIGCSYVARALEGAYKFVLRSKMNESYYISYLSPKYVDQNVKTRGPHEFSNWKDLKFTMGFCDCLHVYDKRI